MRQKPVLCLLVLLMMLVAGCTQSVEDQVVEDQEDSSTNIVELSYTKSGPVNTEISELAIFSIDFETNIPDSFSLQSSLIDSNGNVIPDMHSVIITDSGYQIALVLDHPGEYSIISQWIIEEGFEWSDTPSSVYWNITANAPEEPPAIIQTNSVFLVEGEASFLQANILHDSLETCVVSVVSSTLNNLFTGSVGETGSISVMIVREEVNYESITISATCGVHTESTTLRNISISLSSSDADEDGISDDMDNCPNGESGWLSTPSNDYDADGCRDIDEDSDDDSDSIQDSLDNCRSVVGWVSNPIEDYDSDGCRDSTEDNDDDNDGVQDSYDLCVNGELNWTSDLYEDWDNDGCRDQSEDIDDDNDMKNDNEDLCPKGIANWNSSIIHDFDQDGCQDSSEDNDDDNDGVNDVNSTGIVLDICPQTPLNATDVDEAGCAAIERDSDLDGVNDLIDQCEGTPSLLIVNEVGCSDNDNDGVFANVDDCLNTEIEWTANENGCAVNQIPIAWTSSNSLTGPMQTVPDFTIPTLGGTFTFQNEWTGEDVYLFLFKFTNSDGSSNYNTWNTNPGTLIRNLPDNTHLFYGSYDSSYHNDVVNKRSDVESRLSSAEEEKWENRIHYIDIRANNIQGGLGDMLNSMNSAYFGIDRFQLSRETGSLYAWVTQSNDPYHLSYEPNQWNAEFPAKIRPQDFGIEVVTIYDFERHIGGWGGNHNSYRNTNITLENEISYYDTLEVFHEHACDERRNRYQKADSSYGGCHEWDYEANMYLCDRSNNSICNVEFMRWITTYGREGMWLTDISPYLFMLQEDEERRFRYKGANKGDLTIQLLFSRQGNDSTTSPFDATFAFTGGQFDGSYNNESRYDRSLNFTVPNNTTRIEIVATITGHGFQKDDANCAEFCDHEHHYYIQNNHAYEWHPIVASSTGCENEINNGVVANQFGSWPFGRAGWCAGQDVKQWTYDITSWVDMNATNELTYRGLFNGQEYQPTGETQSGGRNIHAEIWVVFYADSVIE